GGAAHVGGFDAFVGLPDVGGGQVLRRAGHGLDKFADGVVGEFLLAGGLVVEDLQGGEFVLVVGHELFEAGDSGLGLLDVEAGVHGLVGCDFVDDDVGFFLDAGEQLACVRFVERAAGVVLQLFDGLPALLCRGVFAVLFAHGLVLAVRVDGGEQLRGQFGGAVPGGVADVFAVFVVQFFVQCREAAGQRRQGVFVAPAHGDLVHEF